METGVHTHPVASLVSTRGEEEEREAERGEGGGLWVHYK